MRERSSCLCALLLFSLYCSGLAFTLQAYQPTQWSPVSSYILQDSEKKGPSALELYDSKGKLIAKTIYHYNHSARLTKEVHYNAKAQKTGYTEYHYQKGILKKERLLDTSYNVLSSVEFFYDAQAQLQSLKVYDAKKKMRAEQFYRYVEKRLVGGLEIISQKEKNEFQISYEKNKIKRILFTEETLGKIAEIVYKYDKEHKIKERTRSLFLEKKLSRCIYHYNAKAQLRGYVYKSKDVKGNWVKEREVVLLYAIKGRL